MRRMIRYLATAFYKPLLVKYLSRERVYAYKGVQLLVHPDVFHPGFFYSTKILLQQLAGISLRGKTLLELGAGSGLISITAARAGARVTATDINPVATQYLEKNLRSNHALASVITSDLFEGIPEEIFDVIVINPPYYFDAPMDFKEHAWYCGKNGEYFHGLFRSLSNYSGGDTVILMVLCEGSNREWIHSIAQQYGFGFECTREVRNLIERNYVYTVRAASHVNLEVTVERR